MPGAAPGKGFAECKVAFAGSIRLPAKRLNPVVNFGAPRRWPVIRGMFEFTITQSQIQLVQNGKSIHNPSNYQGWTLHLSNYKTGYSVPELSKPVK